MSARTRLLLVLLFSPTLAGPWGATVAVAGGAADDSLVPRVRVDAADDLLGGEASVRVPPRMTASQEGRAESLSSPLPPAEEGGGLQVVVVADPKAPVRPASLPSSPGFRSGRGDVLRARALLAVGNLAEAFAALSRAAALAPGDPRIAADRAVLADRLGNRRVATESYRRALMLAAETPEAAAGVDAPALARRLRYLEQESRP